MKAQLTSIPFAVKGRIKENWVIYVNASSLVATTAITSGLGFVYWWLAARLYPQQVVGFASAAISAMMLLGAVGMLGLGTLLITEIGRDPKKVGSVTITSMLLVGGVSVLLGVLFALAAPALTEELAPLSNNLSDIAIFAIGVAFTSSTLILDQVLIALLRGGMQLGRNILFAVSKLVILYAVARLFSVQTGMNIYFAWMLGNFISLVAIGIYFVVKKIRILYRPHFGIIRHLGRAALAHHATNLILQAPSMIMPILVTTLLSASANASFYASWMIASFVFVLPSHLTTVLHAVGAKSPTEVVTKMRTTMRLAFFLALPASAVLFLGASIVLGIFGKNYAEQADWCLRILSLGVFPLIIKYHFVAFLRIYDLVERVLPLLLLGSVLEVIFSVIGLKIGALSGLSLGWFLAVCVEAIIMYVRLQHMIRTQQTTPDAFHFSTLAISAPTQLNEQVSVFEFRRIVVM